MVAQSSHLASVPGAGLLCQGELVLPSSQAEESRAPLASCLFMSSVGQKVFQRFSLCFHLKVTPTLPVSDKIRGRPSVASAAGPLLILGSSGEMRSPEKEGRNLGGEARDLARGDGKRWSADEVLLRQGPVTPMAAAQGRSVSPSRGHLPDALGGRGFQLVKDFSVSHEWNRSK